MAIMSTARDTLRMTGAALSQALGLHRRPRENCSPMSPDSSPDSGLTFESGPLAIMPDAGCRMPDAGCRMPNLRRRSSHERVRMAAPAVLSA